MPEDDFDLPVVELPTSVVSSDGAVEFLVDQLVLSGRLAATSRDRVIGQVLKRESLGATAIGRGIALPHSKSNEVREVTGIVGKAGHPVFWPGALDGGPVHLVALLITPASDPALCLRALGSLTQRLRDL